MNKFIITKQYKQFAEFCRACHRDKYIGLCYGTAGVGKTESAKHYSKHYQVTKYYETIYSKPLTFQMGKLNAVLYTPSLLAYPKNVINEIAQVQRRFSVLKEYSIYGTDIPFHVREKRQNFAEIVIIDEADRLKPQSFELIRELYDKGETTIIFIGMPGIEKILERFPQLYSRIGFVHQFKPLGKSEVAFILGKHLSKLNTEISDEDFNDQETISAIVRITNGNFRLINRLVKQAMRIMKVNCMTTMTKEIIEAARSCLLIGEK